MSDHETVIAIQPGDVLDGRYELKRLLGSGANGQVWFARDSELGLEIAIKLLPAVLARDSRAVERLKVEASLTMSLTHENIVRLYHFGVDAARGGLPYLVMEFVDGKTAEQLLAEQGGKGLPVEYVEKMAGHLARAIDHAHRRGKLHRDIKPTNIMVSRKDRRLKLLDFGIANETRDSMNRITGVTLGDGSGTPAYMSPQQIIGEDNKANDVYSFAATLYELLAGRPPFVGEGLFHQIRELPPSPIPAVPQHVNDAIAAGLAKKIEDRPRSAAALVTLLRGEILIEEEPPRKAVPRRRSERAASEPSRGAAVAERSGGRASTTSVEGRGSSPNPLHEFAHRFVPEEFPLQNLVVGWIAIGGITFVATKEAMLSGVVASLIIIGTVMASHTIKWIRDQISDFAAIVLGIVLAGIIFSILVSYVRSVKVDPERLDIPEPVEVTPRNRRLGGGAGYDLRTGTIQEWKW